MAKVTRQTIARGLRLLRDHVFDLLADVRVVLQNAEIETEQMARPNGTFRVNLHIPAFDETFVPPQTAIADGAVRIPMILPPLQEFFSSSDLLDESTPGLSLIEVGISWDQRGEPQTIASRGNLAEGVGGAGSIDPTYSASSSLTLSIYEKQFRTTGTGDMEVGRQVVNIELPSVAFTGSSLRFNPFTQRVNEALNPYRTYLFVISAPDLVNTTDTIAFPATQVSLRFKHPLVPRDQGATIQNIPQLNLGVKTPPVLTLGVPVSGTDLLADGASGLQTNVDVFDGVLLEKLTGGYYKDCATDIDEHIADDACYDVIAVPMWSNCGSQRAIHSAVAAGTPAGYAGELPYQGAAPFADVSLDRRLIPIAFPFVVHHVVAAINYAIRSTDNTTNYPTSATLVQNVGVGILTGNKGDVIGYQQVANAQWTPYGSGGVGALSASNLIIDRIKFGDSHKPRLYGEPHMELISVPIVQRAGAAGAGFETQGNPFYVGRATTRYQTRTQCGTIGGGTQVSTAAGCEQFLEVRWSIQDVNGLAFVAGPPGPASANEIYIGQGGHWVYIIGKKHLAGGPGNLPV